MQIRSFTDSLIGPSLHEGTFGRERSLYSDGKHTPSTMDHSEHFPQQASTQLSEITSKLRFSFLLSSWFGGCYTWQCSGVAPGSEFRDYSWRSLADPKGVMGWWRSNSGQPLARQVPWLLYCPSSFKLMLCVGINWFLFQNCIARTNYVPESET